MHSLLARPKIRRAAAIGGLWAAFGLYAALNTHVRSSMSGKPLGWAKSFWAEMAFVFVCALLTPAVLWVARRFPLFDRRWKRHLPAHVLGALLFAVCAKLTWDLLYQPPKAFFREGMTLESVVFYVMTMLDIGILLYAVIVVAHYAAEYYRQYQTGRATAAQLQQQFAQAQLHALRMQLQPHFLFNTLHTISGLIHEDPHAAERMIARLSDLLRLSLEDSKFQEVTLERELHFIRLYLEIQRVRFEDRLRVVYDVHPEAERAVVPNLILQPLVENAIRHGIGSRISGGEIVIRAGVQDGWLSLSVTDNGDGLAGAGHAEHEGVGLSNTRARLAAMYGEDHRFWLEPASGGGLAANLTLPYRAAEVAETRNEYARSSGG